MRTSPHRRILIGLVSLAITAVTLQEAHAGNCGDAVCDPLEDASNCGQDCGCASFGGAACGMDGAETPGGCYCDSACDDEGDCCADACSVCGANVIGSSCCGNGVCNTGENATTCAADCVCGDGICSTGETASGCAIDCGCAAMGCGGQAPGLCYCDGGCAVEGDCCPDACSFCGTEIGPTCCGNGTCDPGETFESCPAECLCGDGVCSGAENPATCPPDCTCGNGFCDTDAGETFENCGNDCTCGNGLCDADQGEAFANCPADCPCGNGTCEPAESTTSCAADCVCGNGTCDSGETADTCTADCGCSSGQFCGEPVVTPGNCGCDPVCFKFGDCCPDACSVCGVNTFGAECCGNGTCDPGETLAGCPADCLCGNGICDPLENGMTCTADCGCVADPGLCGTPDPAPDGGCTCDDACFSGGSCCPDACSVCGTAVFGAQCCGNFTCDPGETFAGCPSDCLCGDGTCAPPEDAENCAADCVCGDSICSTGESAAGCPEDCGCSASPGVCETTQSAPGGCQCDPACFGFGDCCPDVCAACEHNICCGNLHLDLGEECEDSECCTDNCNHEQPGVMCNANDTNPCTDHTCDASGNCLTTNNTAPCDDADPCTNDDTCSGGVCAGEPDTGTSCDDGLDCTMNDACNNGVCTGTPMVCNDGVACTTDECVEGWFCTYFTQDELCDDGIECTVDVCESSGCLIDPSGCPPGICGDGEFNIGEDCDDGNTAALDGCDGSCLVEPMDSNTVPAGGSVDTDPGSGTTEFDPLLVRVTSPLAGFVKITLTSHTATMPLGWTSFGPDVFTIAPENTPQNPLVHLFSMHVSLLPTGLGFTEPLQLLANGLPVPDCAMQSPVVPDPCISDEFLDAAPPPVPRFAPPARALTVLSTEAGHWSFARVTANCGDANGNGTITATDSLQVLRGSVKTLVCPLTLCDVNGNGAVVATDALAVLRRAVNLPITLTCSARG